LVSAAILDKETRTGDQFEFVANVKADSGELRYLPSKPSETPFAIHTPPSNTAIDAFVRVDDEHVLAVLVGDEQEKIRTG
jgi:hypothetical protein